MQIHQIPVRVSNRFRNWFFLRMFSVFVCIYLCIYFGVINIQRYYLNLCVFNAICLYSDVIRNIICQCGVCVCVCNKCMQMSISIGCVTTNIPPHKLNRYSNSIQDSKRQCIFHRVNKQLICFFFLSFFMCVRVCAFFLLHLTNRIEFTRYEQAKCNKSVDIQFNSFIYSLNFLFLNFTAITFSIPDRWSPLLFIHFDLYTIFFPEFHMETIKLLLFLLSKGNETKHSAHTNCTCNRNISFYFSVSVSQSARWIIKSQCARIWIYIPFVFSFLCIISEFHGCWFFYYMYFGFYFWRK